MVCRADEKPSISPTAVFVNSTGEEEESTNYAGSAPLEGKFTANPENVGTYRASYEWRFTMEGEDKPYLVRYEQDTQYTFMRAGAHRIELYATFVSGNDTVAYTKEYWEEMGSIRVNISESKLEMPNAFSPNGDGINDIYKAKEGYRSLTEFHAYIFNRWGQKTLRMGSSGRRLGRKIQREGREAGRVFCSGQSQGGRRNGLRH